MTVIQQEKKAEIDYVVDRIMDRIVPFTFEEKVLIVEEFKKKLISYLRKAYTPEQVTEATKILH